MIVDNNNVITNLECLPHLSEYAFQYPHSAQQP